MEGVIVRTHEVQQNATPLRAHAPRQTRARMQTHACMRALTPSWVELMTRSFELSYPAML